MLVGKRSGPTIRRTTSMAGIDVDPTATIGASQPSDYRVAETISAVHHNPAMMSVVGGDDYVSSPRKRLESRSLVMENAKKDGFLRNCSLCSRQLRHNRDIYMYRGDRAFCSMECREKQMKLDERRSKNGVVSSKKVVHV